MKIWFNPRCMKCRAARGILEGAGAEVVERLYLEEPPTQDELTDVLEALDMQPWELTRLGEPVAEELGMDEWEREDPERWIAAMVDNPILIQRPIVIDEEGRAALGRPPEAVRDLL